MLESEAEREVEEGGHARQPENLENLECNVPVRTPPRSFKLLGTLTNQSYPSRKTRTATLRLYSPCTPQEALSENCWSMRARPSST